MEPESSSQELCSAGGHVFLSFLRQVHLLINKTLFIEMEEFKS